MNKRKTLIFGLVVIFLISNLIYIKDNLSNPNKKDFNIDTRDTKNTFNTKDSDTIKEILMNLEDFPGELNDSDSIELSEWGVSTIPGAPEIPVRQFQVLLSPNVDPHSVTIEIIEDIPKVLEGGYNYEPAPFMVTSTEDGSVFSESFDLNDAYEKDELWPLKIIELSSVEQMRDAKILKFNYYPLQYNPIQKEVIEHTNVKISIRWQETLSVKKDPLTLKFLTDLGKEIENLDEMLPIYLSIYSNELRTSGTSMSSYIIITTNAIEANSDKLSSFVDYKNATGFNVEVITEDEYGSATGKQRVLNIRNWLQNNYISKSIEYVLLIGNPDPDDEGSSYDEVGDIPMLMCWPRRYASSYRNSPTDYFYADLTGDWDVDNDGYYGEYPDDFGGVDFSPEVYVGRIPVYNSEYSVLDDILQRTIDHHKNNISMRPEMKKILLPMAMSNYQNEDRTGIPRTDGRDLPEHVYKNICEPLGMDDTVMYERDGISPVPASAYHYDTEISLNHFIDCFNDNYGAVFWSAHGSGRSASRKIWTYDDGDNVPESYEMSWLYLMSSNYVNNLQNDMPAFFFQSSCSNGMPEDNSNLGYALLKRGAAISTVSASTVSWYRPGIWSPSKNIADNVGLGYYYIENLIKNKLTNGHALYEAKSSVGSYSDRNEWMNKMDFNLYGDPQLGYWSKNEIRSNCYIEDSAIKVNATLEPPTWADTYRIDYTINYYRLYYVYSFFVWIGIFVQTGEGLCLFPITVSGTTGYLNYTSPETSDIIYVNNPSADNFITYSWFQLYIGIGLPPMAFINVDYTVTFMNKEGDTISQSYQSNL